ncbi:mCG148431 [Mus musculus]|nr:mCG148431 [Mus musculus]
MGSLKELLGGVKTTSSVTCKPNISLRFLGEKEVSIFLFFIDMSRRVGSPAGRLQWTQAITHALLHCSGCLLCPCWILLSCELSLGSLRREFAL